MPIKLYNTATKKIEKFKPRKVGKATLYTCGPTVYGFPHVGNWLGYIYWDVLIRTLAANGIDVERTINITDVGHLVSDEDEGEDKMAKGARREKKTMWDLAKFYTDDFLEGMHKLNMIPPSHITKATEYIDQQLELVRALKVKGYTYQINDGIYFDTSKFPKYADFAHLDLETLRAGARIEFNSGKRNPSDFALWKFANIDRKDMIWPTPEDLVDREGDYPAQVSAQVMGFPGWHLECSAMAISTLGETIDIHTGGIDHIPVHHTNEIAQSEAVTDKPFVRYWLHNNHMKSEGTKISKSLGNGYTLQDLESRDYTALDLRMFALQSHFQTESNFTWENLSAAKNRLINWQNAAVLRHQVHSQPDKESAHIFEGSVSRVVDALSDNLNAPQALAEIDAVFSKVDHMDAIDGDAFKAFIIRIDELLGLGLADATPDISDDVKKLLVERTRARENQDWAKSDEIRDQLAVHGVHVRDTKHGSVWSYN